MSTTTEVVINAIPFVLYTVLLFKSFRIWRRLRKKADGTRPLYYPALQWEIRKKVNLLMAVLALVSLCSVTFMASNIYALLMLDKTFLSLKVFQMFVVSNCAAYWLVLDLISKDAE